MIGIVEKSRFSYICSARDTTVEVSNREQPKPSLSCKSLNVPQHAMRSSQTKPSFLGHLSPSLRGFYSFFKGLGDCF